MPNLPKGFDVKAHERSARKFANMLPTRGNCDLTDPMEMFLWTYVAMPGMNGGQMAFPSSYGMLLSQHQFELGVMLQCGECGHTKDPSKVYLAPSAQDAHWMTSPGRWVSPEKAAEQTAKRADGDPIDNALAPLSNQQKAALFERLRKQHEAGHL